ncbi:MAG: LytTR family DNA-binding domain-containing protein [Bacteroidales bacterium]|jgi:hypothetical protein|nr:LytTR family DNA-binding domain-containing protein [Bacteroidales bacterium]MDD3273885.1 LytTR family DNA-binding domain-containing protein [Bacteroidales bacterium]MDD4058935.1 LytTR family DNA-binding domain-containing protein [Bacteroidales bacterium]
MHPVTETKRDIILGAAAVTTVAALLTLLFDRYGDSFTLLESTVASSTYTALLSLSAFYYWNIRQYLKAPGSKLAVAILAQLSSVAGASVLLSLLSQSGTEHIYSVVPILLPIGILLWISIELWYSLQHCREEAEPSSEEIKRVQSNIIENISVKEGNRMHIIRAEQLHHIQAYGDYVMLHTSDGKYIKEETMKHFEASLPNYFVRIHRSAIVNVNMIVKTELYGKESYTIHLSSGEKLRASAGGYKLLKEKLSLN